MNTNAAVEELITKIMVDFQWNKGSTPTFTINAPEPVADFILAASGTIRVATLMGVVYELTPRPGNTRKPCRWGRRSKPT